MAKESKQRAPHFEQRFNIEVGMDEARKRFMNRVTNKVDEDLKGLIHHTTIRPYKQAMYNTANKLGIMYSPSHNFYTHVSGDFYDFLKVLEAIYETFRADNAIDTERFSDIIQYAISLSETDLCIEWRNGTFWPSGAKLLDETLINDNLKWLADKGYQDVLVPFEKGLRHFLEAIQKPERLGDTVTDVYEAVEALAKRVTGRDVDLSTNAEQFIKKLKLSAYYREMLKDYIGYANDYRHAAELGKVKNPLLRNEVEAFIYTSGLFIRLAVQQSA